eukprot:CAMPEP_0194132330 /NCGR_PEP_ID=MMETSP0152-20130528/2826_1 /TAXON_ID=1049557 /ORGANISM="Thalassiothrix antarctica, Strain L6-D1" /LENGTH=233 /DNA_ID=CAMNT_0038827351 /DNA_START=74 /DNA_END=775 /DNA_ORIENTATION=-
MSNNNFLLLLLLGTTTSLVSSVQIQFFANCQKADGTNGAFCQSPKGTCVTLDGDDFETCVCGVGRTDPPNCDNDLDECASDNYPCNGPEGSSFCVDEFRPTSYKCGCNDGWRPVLADNVTVIIPAPILIENRPLDCININECEENPQICGTDAATCNDLPGSYECLCKSSNLIYDQTLESCIEQPSALPSMAPSLQPVVTPVVESKSVSSSSVRMYTTAVSAVLLSFLIFSMD